MNRLGITTYSRLFAGSEIALLTLLFILAIWEPWFSGVTCWSVGSALLFFATITASALLRRHDWRESGFRLDNLRSGLIAMGAIVLCVWIAIAIPTTLLEISIEPVSMATASGRLLSGVFQEALFLGYFFQRWKVLLGKPWFAVVANAMWFGLIHAPEPGLVAVAMLGGFFVNYVFLRIKNVYAIGLGHGLLSILLLPILVQSDFLATAQIGPPALGKFAGRIMAELKPGERIGICSRFLGPDQFGLRFDRDVERVLRGKRDEVSAREAFMKFLAAKERVFCVITAPEWHRYVDGNLESRLFVLDENYVWKDLNRMLSRDEGILGFFRDHVLLVSNRSSI